MALERYRRGLQFWFRFRRNRMWESPNSTLYPFLELEAGSTFRVPTFRNYTLVNPQVSSPRDLGVRHNCTCTPYMGYSFKIFKAISTYYQLTTTIFNMGFDLVLKKFIHD
jgi:hypothetical protein